MQGASVGQRASAADRRRAGAAAVALLLGAVAAPTLVGVGAAGVAQAQAGPADGRQYKAGATLPAKFLAALGNTAKTGYNAKTSTLTVDGRSRDVVTTEIGWVKDFIDDSGFAFAPGGSVQGDGWQNLGSRTDPEWIEFVKALKPLARTNGEWSFVTLTYAVPSAGSPAAIVTDAASETAKRGIEQRLAAHKAKVAALSASTRPGEYFSAAKVPTNLAGVRQAMLEYGNAERKTPDFRRLVGSTIALDLDSRPKTVRNLEGRDEPVMAQPDMQLDERLNRAAQFQAEANATGAGSGHDGPATWTDPAGKAVKMAGLGDRTAYFQVPSDWGAPEIAGGGAAGDQPYVWMKTDTHYRWFWGVDGTYPLVGYGAAQDGKGVWHYVGVARRIAP